MRSLPHRPCVRPISNTDTQIRNTQSTPQPCVRPIRNTDTQYATRSPPHRPCVRPIRNTDTQYAMRTSPHRPCVRPIRNTDTRCAMRSLPHTGLVWGRDMRYGYAIRDAQFTPQVLCAANMRYGYAIRDAQFPPPPSHWNPSHTVGVVRILCAYGYTIRDAQCPPLAALSTHNLYAIRNTQLPPHNSLQYTKVSLNTHSLNTQRIVYITALRTPLTVASFGNRPLRQFPHSAIVSHSNCHTR